MSHLLRPLVTSLIAFSLLSRPDPDVAEGNRLYAEGKYQEAIDAYQRVKPEDGAQRRRLAYNRGTALLRLGEYAQARDALREAQGDADKQLRSRAAFNEGNAALLMKEPKAAVQGYRRALLDDPGFESARRNLELALLALRPPPDAGPPDGGDSGDGGEGDSGQGDGGQGGGGDGASGGDGGSGSADGGGGQGDAGSPGRDGGAGQQSQPKPQQAQPPKQQQEITQQDALRMLDALRDAEQDQMLMRFLQQEAQEPRSGKNW